MLFVSNDYAGGARSNWSDFYDNVEGAPECWQDGYDGSLNHPFNQARHKECQFDIEEYPDFGEPYYEAFIHGCNRRVLRILLPLPQQWKQHTLGGQLDASAF